MSTRIPTIPIKREADLYLNVSRSSLLKTIINTCNVEVSIGGKFFNRGLTNVILNSPLCRKVDVQTSSSRVKGVKKANINICNLAPLEVESYFQL